MPCMPYNPITFHTEKNEIQEESYKHHHYHYLACKRNKWDENENYFEHGNVGMTECS